MKEISYHRADGVADAVTLAAQFGERGMFLAGGQSVVTDMRTRRFDDDREVIDIGRLSELSYIEVRDDGVGIGALTTHADLLDADSLTECLPALPAMVEQVADVQVRNMGTVGGVVARAKPRTDYPVFTEAAGATFEVATASGSRTVPAAAFFVDEFETALGTAELLTELTFPIPPNTAALGFDKFAKRSHDFPIVNVAAYVDCEDGVCTTVRIRVGGLTGTPATATAAEAHVQGRDLDTVNAGQVGELAREDVASTMTDTMGTEHELGLVASLVRDVVGDCIDECAEP